MQVFDDINLLEYKMRLSEPKELPLYESIKTQRKELQLLLTERRKNKLECSCVGLGGMLVFGNCSLNGCEIILSVNNTQKSKIIVNKGEFSWFFQTYERGIWKVEMKYKEMLLIGVDNIYLESYTGISSISWKQNRYIEVTFANKVIENCWLSLWEKSNGELKFIKERKMDRGVKIFCFDGKDLKNGSYMVRLHAMQNDHVKESKTELLKKIKSEHHESKKRREDGEQKRREIDKKHVILISSFNVVVNK